MICKYGEGNHLWFPNVVCSSFGVGVWKGIRKGWASFERHISFEIGNGTWIKFWRDKWCDDEKLWSFPNLFNLAMDKDCLVSSVLHLEEGRVSWSPTFRRNLQDFQDWRWILSCKSLINYTLSRLVTGRTKCCGRDLRAKLSR